LAAAAMTQMSPKGSNVVNIERKLVKDFLALSRRMLRTANRGVTRSDFVREVSEMLLDFCGCDAVEVHLPESEKYFRFESTRRPEGCFRFEIMAQEGDVKRGNSLHSNHLSDLERLSKEMVHGRLDRSQPFFTKNGSFWTGDTSKPLTLRHGLREQDEGVHELCIGGPYRSLAVIPFEFGDQRRGLLQLKSLREEHFQEDELKLYEGVAQILGAAAANRRAQFGLRERIKELTCLYRMTQLAEQPGTSLDELLENLVELLPPAWLYPETASARIFLDGHPYPSSGFQEGQQKLRAEIVVKGQRRGVVEVTYKEEKPEHDEGPYLKEERNLIDAVAREIARILERRQAKEDTWKLQEQLKHADRLATIGQLAAGVAHELNEPLGNVLGFAQLAIKDSGLPEQAKQDLEKIVSASLHAREVIKKLLLFARQKPPMKTKVDLNQLVEEELYFLESRCAKEGIELVRSLSIDLPEITADREQLHQVLVNLVVNAIQAMPAGGKLTISTSANEDHVSLIVEDTGIGMEQDVVKQIFIPFFTTKEIGQGTGLGLSVVHGIVTAHGGSINVESEVGRGSRFVVQLPLKASSTMEEVS
jgi:signal transduction histidine kinase